METKRIGLCFPSIGLPEVDRVLQGSLFPARPSRFPTARQLPMVDLQGGKFLRKRDHKRPQTNSCRISTDKNKIDDRISKLPDEILEFIISLLRLRERATTSILSRRWRNLWTTSTSVLSFDLIKKLGYKNNITDRSSAIKRFWRNQSDNFIAWVNQMLQLCGSSKIRALRISYNLGLKHASDIDRWIDYAADKGLTDLTLDFSLFFMYPFTLSAYNFPFRSFASLRYLVVSGCNFSYPPEFKGFNSLVSLILVENFLTKYDLQNILSNCSSLECLTLKCCLFDGFQDLEFSGPSLPLKHLCLEMKQPDTIRTIEVHDVSLISLELIGSNTKLSIKNSPHLARLVPFSYFPVDIKGDLPRLETLFHAAISWYPYRMLPEVSVLKNLKYLVFDAKDDITDLLEVIDLLEACPLLQKLELDMGIAGDLPTERLTEISTRRGIANNNLKDIEIYGFEDRPEKKELIKYLLRNAIVLEKMKIFSFSKTYHGNGKWVLIKGTVEQTPMSLKKVRELFQNEARSSTELTFCPHK